MRILAAKAAQHNLSPADRIAIQEKINSHITQIDHIAATTDLKAKKLINQDESDLH